MSLGDSTDVVAVRVPGKINLELVVGPLREDGFHELSTVFQAVSVYDRVSVRPSDRWSVHVTGPYADRVGSGAREYAIVALPKEFEKNASSCTWNGIISRESRRSAGCRYRRAAVPPRSAAARHLPRARGCR